MKWEKTGRRVTPAGTDIDYSCGDPEINIQSRKRSIPHAGDRSGDWEHTTYWVRRRGEDVRQLQRLSDAREYAEKLIAGGEK